MLNVNTNSFFTYFFILVINERKDFLNDLSAIRS